MHPPGKRTNAGLSPASLSTRSFLSPARTRFGPTGLRLTLSNSTARRPLTRMESVKRESADFPSLLMTILPKGKSSDASPSATISFSNLVHAPSSKSTPDIEISRQSNVRRYFSPLTNHIPSSPRFLTPASPCPNDSMRRCFAVLGWTGAPYWKESRAMPPSR